MTNRVVTPPTSSPVTLEDARTFRGLVAYVGSPATHPLDPILELGIDAAREWVEQHVGLALGAQTREEVLDAFPEFEIVLPFGPVHDIESLTYVDEDGAEQTLTEGTDFVLDAVSRPAVVLPVTGTTWPATVAAANVVAVRYVTGYTCEGDSPDDHPVPAVVKQVVHLFAGHYYENREAVSQGVDLKEIPLGIERLLFHLRRLKVA